MKRLPMNVGHTRLQNTVRLIINRHSADYESGAQGYIEDVLYGGCQSGVVSELIYYTDTLKFYAQYQHDIDNLLQELCRDTGCTPAELFGDKWERDDPLARHAINKNLLAWFGFEETTRQLANENGIEA